MARRLSPSQFQEYLELYFRKHIYPKDLCSKFNLSVSNHSRRIRRAIELGLKLKDGTLITRELYLEEKLRQDSMQAKELMKKRPTLLSDIRYIAAYKGKAGQKKGRYSELEEAIILTSRYLKKPYAQIQKILGRTPSQLRKKYYEMQKKEKIPKLPARNTSSLTYKAIP